MSLKRGIFDFGLKADKLLTLWIASYFASRVISATWTTLNSYINLLLFFEVILQPLTIFVFEFGIILFFILSSVFLFGLYFQYVKILIKRARIKLFGFVEESMFFISWFFVFLQARYLYIYLLIFLMIIIHTLFIFWGYLYLSNHGMLKYNNRLDDSSGQQDS